MISFRQHGDFKKLDRYLSRIENAIKEPKLAGYAEAGLQALKAATPKDSGATAEKWGYEIVRSKNGFSIQFYNDSVNQGVNIAVILQYGHGTGTGGYVEGIDYINPALRPIFEQIAEEAWEEVRSA